LIVNWAKLDHLKLFKFDCLALNQFGTACGVSTFECLRHYHLSVTGRQNEEVETENGLLDD